MIEDTIGENIINIILKIGNVNYFKTKFICK